MKKATLDWLILCLQQIRYNIGHDADIYVYDHASLSIATEYGEDVIVRIRGQELINDDPDLVAPQYPGAR